MSTPVEPTPNETLCITGAPRSGKTTALTDRAASWASSSDFLSDRPDFLFFCATPITAEVAKQLLATRGLAVDERQLNKPRGLVTTPYNYALRILADPGAEALTGRSPNVLSRQQEAVFFEDLKTSGMKRRRLREMWAFFLCGWANLNDDDPEWVQTAEERVQLNLARDILAFEDAMLAAEVVNLAVHVLRELPDVLAAFSASVVLADDYPQMSRASQELVNLLATDKLAVAGDPEPMPTAFEPYPWTTGLADFCERYDHVLREELPEPVRTAERSWQAAPDLGQEMGLIACTVAEALESGTAPDRIAVVGTNRTWRANLLRALRSCSIPAEELKPSRQHPLGREMDEATEADRTRVLKHLAADPSDSRAWREWLSFDDALGRSAAVSELRQVALPQGLTLAEALERLNASALEGMSADDPFATSLLTSYRKALDTLATSPCPTSTCQVFPNGEQTFPNGLSAEHAEEFPGTHRDAATPARGTSAQSGIASAIAIAKPEDLFGRTFDLVVFGGFVNGFIPSRDMCDPGVIVGAARERTERADRAAIRLVISRTTKRILFTGFESCPLETAEQLKLHIARIRLQNSERVCTIEPSAYLEQLDPVP